MAVARRDVDLLSGSKWFDADWYAGRYRDVVILQMDAIEHYLRIGWRLGRDPGPQFSGDGYLAAHSDVGRSGMNPLVHFLRYGEKEGRRVIAPGHRVRSASKAAKAESSSSIRQYEGLRQQPGADKTVLVCAHVAGKHLFGGERSLLDILDGFLEIGYRVVVATPGLGNREYLKALQDRCHSVVSFKYGWWRRGVGIDQQVVAQFASLIAEFKVDAVHANTIMLREPLAAARRLGIPGVVHVRELVGEDVALCELIGQEPDEIIDHVMDAADLVVANSKATASAFTKRGCHTSMVFNTVDAEAFAKVDPPLRDTSTIRVGLVSSNLPKKGILDFVAVATLLAERLPAARFHLVGPENKHVEEFRVRQRAGELPANIVFAGYQEDPIKAMASLDVLLNLSHFQESFGRTVLEAMAAGRPVVVYDWGALPELVTDGETGRVVAFRDVAAIADAIEALCQSPDKIVDMGRAGQVRAVQIYDKTQYAEQLRHAYRKVFDLSAELGKRKAVLPARAGIKPRGRQRMAYFLWHFPVPSETFVLNELRVLVAAGHDVKVYCRQSPHKDFVPDFPIEWVRVSDPPDLARKLREDARTVVHSHFTYPTVTDMVWPACELAEIPFTFIAHAQDIFRYSNDEKNRIGEVGRSPWCLKVLVPSHFHRDYVESRGVPADKILINPNGIDPALYAEGLDIDHAPRKARSICAIHRFTAKKGLEQLIEAGKELASDGISIHLYGYGELEERYRELITSANLSNVHLHGPVGSRDEMLQVFARHDLFACPSVRAADGDMDGIPTVLMEAMASGLPVMATAISGIPDLVREGITGMVCEATASSIVSSVRRFYESPDVAIKSMIDDALSLVRRDYNSARLTSALLRLWEGRAIDVMIVSWNNPAQLGEVIRRLQKFTSLPWHLIICDNGSESSTGALLCDVYAKYENVTITLNRDNAFVGPGTNICMDLGRSDYAVYVCGKEGFVVNHGWERSLIDYMDQNPEVGLAGTICHSPGYLTGAAYPKGIPVFSKFRNQSFASDNADRPFGHVQGGFFAIRRAMYDAIGGFSDEVPHNYTDVEYSYYVESQGWKLGTPPRLLALFNKTRPGLFSRVDESVAAMHPPMLEDLALLDRIAQRGVAHCNICGWHGGAFDVGPADAPTCPGCTSRPADRSLYRLLAESTLTYRRLPALGVNVGAAMEGIWRHQFQGRQLTKEEFTRQVRTHGRLDFNAGALKVVYYNGLTANSPEDEAALSELGRLLAPDGVLLLKFPQELARKDIDSALQLVSSTIGLDSVEAVRFSSRVVGLDRAPIHVGRKLEAARCVS